jgi:hypothetical protein
MPYLVTKVEGKVLDNFVGGIYVFSNLSGQVQFEDYIELNGFIAYLQNFTQVGYVEKLVKPLNFGLKTQFNLPTQTLSISY